MQIVSIIKGSRDFFAPKVLFSIFSMYSAVKISSEGEQHINDRLIIFLYVFIYIIDHFLFIHRLMTHTHNRWKIWKIGNFTLPASGTPWQCSLFQGSYFPSAHGKRWKIETLKNEQPSRCPLPCYYTRLYWGLLGLFPVPPGANPSSLIKPASLSSANASATSSARSSRRFPRTLRCT